MTQYPGGLYLAWELQEDFQPPEGATTQYRLQSCVGKVTKNTKNPNFRDEYEGEGRHCVVRNLTAKTLYTFRICCCNLDEGDSPKIWSPWSVHHEKVIQIPAHKWVLSDEVKDSYELEQKGQTALKTVKNEAVIYSQPSEHFVNFPAQFRVDSAGKRVGNADCIAATFRRENCSSGLHLRDSTFAFHADGTVWINGKASATRFPNFYR